MFKAIVEAKQLQDSGDKGVDGLQISMLEFFLCAFQHSCAAVSPTVAQRTVPTLPPSAGLTLAAHHRALPRPHSINTSGGASALHEMFANYDKDGSGQLDEAEAFMSLEDMVRPDARVAVPAEHSRA